MITFICTFLRIITSEREEGHHERLWYKTFDPSKTISIRSSIDVPSFPRSKWDSENEFSDEADIDDNVFLRKSPIKELEKTSQRLHKSNLPKSKLSPESNLETEIVSDKQTENKREEAKTSKEYENKNTSNEIGKFLKVL